MSFRLVPKSVILNDLEWRNGHYAALLKKIILNHGHAVLSAIAELLVRNLHAVACILSISSAFLFIIRL